MDRTGRTHRGTGCRPLIKLAAVALFAACHGCGNSGASSGAPGRPPAETARAEEIAAKMLAVYRKAKSYADHASYVQHSVRRNEGVERELPFFDMSVAFARPNRLRLSFQESVESSVGRKGFDLASNGAIIRSTAGELAGQVHEALAPQQLTPENLLPDPYLRDALEGRTLGDVFPQLAMLLNKDDQALVFPHDEPPYMLEGGELRGRVCYRIGSRSPAGERVLWIDRHSYVLHRMELPIDAQRKALDADNQYMSLAVWIDFEDVSLDADIEPQAFEKQVAKDERRVRRFVALPLAAPPEQLGRPLAVDFQFKTLDGKPITADSLAGKTALLDFWQVQCPGCREHTPLLQQAYEQLKDADDFQFYAVNTDAPIVPNNVVEKTFQSWGGGMTIVRDLEDHAFGKKLIDRTPTLLLLDAKGRLQYIHAETHKDPAALVKLVNRVRKGDDLAAEVRAEYRRLVRDYQRELDAVTIKDAQLEVKLTPPEPGKRQPPEHYSATELWSTKGEDLAQPGNVLVVDSPDSRGQPRIFALDGARAVAEFDLQGKLVTRHELPAEASPAARNGILRTANDGGSRRWYAVSGVGWQKLHLFDEAWKPLLTFPKDRHPGIADVQFIPQGPEPRLAVGYWGGVGVQGVGLDGKRKWADRTLDQVVALALVPAKDKEAPELWCTSNRGAVLVLDAQGKPQRELSVGLRSVMHLASATVEGVTHFCGLAVEGAGQYDAIGFDREGELLWRRRLPPGEYRHQVERIQHVTLPGGDQAWMIAAADGTILWLDHEGQVLDQFAYGQPLTGLALAATPDAAILLVSTPESLTAWTLKNLTAKEEDLTAKDAKDAKEKGK